ncbi:MAG: hypothetical protein HY255_00295 [Betaproteobacteria bacterium]|nr:hypothetical protein [Betaproteobacteria bacterium]
MDRTKLSVYRFLAANWWLLIVVIAATLAIGVLAYQIYAVYSDPLTLGRRWQLTSSNYKLLLALILVDAAMIAGMRMRNLVARYKEEIERNPAPARWIAASDAVNREEVRDGKLLLRFPRLASYMSEPDEVECLDNGLPVKALVMVRDESKVIAARLDQPKYYLGRIEPTGRLLVSASYPKIASAVEVFLSQRN